MAEEVVYKEILEDGKCLGNTVGSALINEETVPTKLEGVESTYEEVFPHVIEPD